VRILESDMFAEPIHGEDILVCPVNLVGVMRKGLALKFKKAYPYIEWEYKNALEYGELNLGMNYKIQEETFPQIMLLATKRHWKEDSRKEDVVAGLIDLKRYMKRYPGEHIRLPAVGCGEGNLSFEWLVEQCWTLFTGMNLTLYTPWAGGKR
jgi:hypothetical protein